jgi:hypothetical protein
MELDHLALSQLFSTASAAWTAVLIFALFVARMWSGAPAMLDKWLAFKTAKEAAKAADWNRLREEVSRLHERCDYLQHEVDECRRREGEWMSRAIAAEAAHAGMGASRQEVAIIESAKRITEKKE